MGLSPRNSVQRPVVSARTVIQGLIALRAAKNLQWGRYAHSCWVLTCRHRKRCPDAEFPGISQSVWRAGHGAFYCAAWN
jgi:hypothetical protein